MCCPTMTPLMAVDPVIAAISTSGVKPGTIAGGGRVSAQMRVLAVNQPWQWAILHGGKDVENRVHNPVAESERVA